ncbi:TIR domain-containing protein [Kitasatospora sp. NPDC056446]|uniref:TIR domain-containing protein n=1 Tax=Kitasatospora sp. NPDC056446 TaxID=3345819 RepID=UPI00368B9304
MSISPSGPGSRIFVSYAHHDDDLLDQAVRSFTEDLKKFYAAKTGNDVVIFFDHDSIGWGSNWRDNIDGELRSASIFMPIITMQYFNRQACRDELNAFHGGAKRLGAGYLILPIVIMGAGRISADHPIPEVGLIEALQYENLEGSFLAGTGTREWREGVSRIADKLILAMERAEERMTEIAATEQAGETVESQAELDLLGAMEEIERIGIRMKVEMEDVESILTEWVEALTQGMADFGPGKSASVMRAKTIQMAQEVEARSRRLYESSTALAKSVDETDTLLRSVVGGLSEAGGQYSTELLESFLLSAQSDSAQLAADADSMGQLLDMLKALETLSVPLRKAIKPGRVGFTKLQDARHTIGNWSQIRVP